VTRSLTSTSPSLICWRCRFCLFCFGSELPPTLSCSRRCHAWWFIKFGCMKTSHILVYMGIWTGSESCLTVAMVHVRASFFWFAALLSVVCFARGCVLCFWLSVSPIVCFWFCSAYGLFRLVLTLQWLRVCDSKTWKVLVTIVLDSSFDLSSNASVWIMFGGLTSSILWCFQICWDLQVSSRHVCPHIGISCSKEFALFGTWIWYRVGGRSFRRM